MLSDTETEIAVWHAEGREQEEIAGWLQITQQAVSKRISAIQSKLTAAGLPEIKPLVEKHDTRHNRNFDASRCGLI